MPRSSRQSRENRNRDRRFPGNRDIEKARAEFERAQNVEERFHKDFDGWTFLNDKSANTGLLTG
jgi:hypothetical protein